MSNPTLEELKEQLEVAYCEVRRLEEECARLREVDAYYKQGYELGSKLAAFKEGMVAAGASEEDAMKVILTGITSQI